MAEAALPSGSHVLPKSQLSHIFIFINHLIVISKDEMSPCLIHVI
jgi:hypothetical protein